MSLLHQLVHAVSADMILEHTKTIWEHNRWSNFSQYEEAAEYVMQRLHEYGCETEKIELAADGKNTYGDAIMPLAWDCSDARVEISAPEQKVLVERSASPNLVGMWSPATPGEGLEGELVHIASGEASELRKIDAKGKFILTPGRLMDIRQAAVHAEAAGVICYGSNKPDAKNDVRWLNQNTTNEGGWGTLHDENPLIALSVSPEMGRELIGRIEKEPVKLRVFIQAELYADPLPIISGLIPGESREQEAILIAPLYGPGANYHAVAAATLLEAARIIQEQIENRRFPRPQRSIRFYFIPRIYGSIALAQQRRNDLKKGIFALYLEGGAGNPDYSWCRWSYRMAPSYQRHFADGLAWQILNQYLQEWRPQRFMESRAFALNADVLFNDPFIGVNTHALYGGTVEECRYTSLDTPDTLDPRSCIDFAAACAAVMFSMASVTAGDIPDLAFWNFMLGQERINDDVQMYLNRIKEARNLQDLNELLTETQNLLPLRAQMEKNALQTLDVLDVDTAQSVEWKSVIDLQGTLDAASVTALQLIKSHLEVRCNQLNITPDQLQASELPKRDERVPRRTDKAVGTITLDTLPYDQWTSPVKNSPRYNPPFILAWWLADGQRTIGEIERILSMELRLYRECIPAWFTFLEKQGYITFAHESQEDVEKEEMKSEVG